jgi:hypothetical protein
MNISSAQVDYSTISNDTGFIAQEISSIDPSIMANISAAAGGLDTITISGGTGSSYYYTNGAGSGGFSSDTITISNGGYSIGAIGSTTTINNISTSSFNWKMPEEFVDAFPDFNRIEKMCKEYPGLAIAFEKFKTVYNLVKDHYDTPEDQRPIP